MHAGVIIKQIVIRKHRFLIKKFNQLKVTVYFKSACQQRDSCSVGGLLSGL